VTNSSSSTIGTSAVIETAPVDRTARSSVDSLPRQSQGSQSATPRRFGEGQDANPRWGAPRIHGELLKLGIDVSQATVAKYMGQIMAGDLFVVPTATGRLLFVLVIVLLAGPGTYLDVICFCDRGVQLLG
jgi:hypothetical protein